jgi:hypothetical protein
MINDEIGNYSSLLGQCTVHCPINNPGLIICTVVAYTVPLAMGNLIANREIEVPFMHIMNNFILYDEWFLHVTMKLPMAFGTV